MPASSPVAGIPFVIAMLLLSGCLGAPGASNAPSPTEDGEHESSTAGEAAELLVDRAVTYGPSVAADVRTPDGESVFGPGDHGSPLKRLQGARVTENHSHLVITATHSETSTGNAVGYRIDGGDVTWVYDLENGVPMEIKLPPDAAEDPARGWRWEFFWNVNSDAAQGSGAHVNAEVHVLIEARP